MHLSSAACLRRFDHERIRLIAPGSTSQSWASAAQTVRRRQALRASREAGSVALRLFLRRRLELLVSSGENSGGPPDGQLVELGGQRERWPVVLVVRAGERVGTDVEALVPLQNHRLGPRLLAHRDDDSIAPEAQHQPRPLRLQVHDHACLILQPEIAAARRADRKAIARLAIGAGELREVAEIVHLPVGLDGREADAGGADASH